MRPPARVRGLRRAFARAASPLIGLAVTAFAAVSPADGATLAVHVETLDGRALAGAVVTARPLGGSAHKVAAVHAVMDQVNRAFVPDLLVIPVGSTVEFPNSDSIRHQIYSCSPSKRFQLPLYRGKPYPPVHFDQPGVVTLGCNIHDQMLAYVVVTDAPYFGRSDASGDWTVDLPRGRYRLTLWHPRLRESEADLERELTLGEAPRAVLTLRLTKALQPAPLADRAHPRDY